jgi:minor extracellular serine protease Vpr
MPRLVWKAVLAAAVVTLVTVAGGAVAKGAGGSHAVRFAKIDPALYASDGAAGKFTPASLSNKQVTAVVQLGGAPVAVRDADAKKQGAKLTGAQKNAIRQQLTAQQDALHGRLANAGARIVGQMQDAYNGVQVTIAQKNLAKLASLPNVVGVHAVAKFKPANINGVPFVGAPAAWQNFSATGTGVKVASLDTGIDYTHADFGGPGTAAAWDYAFAHSTVDPATDSTLAAEFGPSAARVKGGTDFVGDDYNADDPDNSVPQPDKNPLDCNGHGSHTAGTMAGSGVTSGGATYGGPYNGSTSTNPSDWKVFPGVAPRADIYAYRVFGCAGSSSIVDLAIDQAVADGMNVISMSLGSDFGGADDPTSVAAQNAVNDGVSVVASAGNAGGNGYMVGSPSTANGVLSVAAMDGTTATFPGAHLVLGQGGGGPIDAINANGATVPTATYTLRVVPGTGQQVSTPTGSGIDGDPISVGCTVADVEAPNGGHPWPAGTVLVVERGICARVHKAVVAFQAGAAAVIMVNNSAGFPPVEGEITSDPDDPDFHGTVTIPFLGVPGSSTPSTSTNGQALLAGNGGSITLSPTNVQNSGYKTTTSFSSGGPRNPDSAPKPDVIAPGLSVISAGVGTGTGGATISGTSMACPMTAGIAALVKQVHPAWNGLQIKAAIMNTADRSLNTGYNVRRAGAGVVQAQKAVNSSVLATTADQLDSIAFGYVPGSGDYPDHKAITLTNNGATDATYDLSVVTNGDQRGAVVGVSPSSVTVPHGGSMTVQVNLSISESAFAALPSVDTFVIGPGGVLTVRGDIVATPTAGDASAQELAVPYLVAPRGLSNVVASTPAAWTMSNSPAGKGFTSTLPVRNNGIHGGTADLYAWGIHDAADSNAPMDVRDVGVQVQPGANFGVSDSDRGLVFLINTYGQATNQSVNEYDVLIDTNRDGQADFIVAGFDLGAVLTGDNDGRYGSFTIDAATGDIIDAFFADAPMNGSTIELPAIASEIGLAQKAAKPTAFRYTVNAFSLVPGGIVDTMGSAPLFDPFHPAVSSGVLNADGTPKEVAVGSTISLPLSIDKSQQAKTPALGWLVASVDDDNGAPQADEVAAPALK